MKTNFLSVRVGGKWLSVRFTVLLSGASITALVAVLTQMALRLMSGPVVPPSSTPPPSVASESPGCVQTLEHRSMPLDDGSRIELNANSCVAVLYSPTQRQINLLSGEAIFRVNPDSGRPFVVKVRNTSVVAIGTEFDIDVRAESTRVLVMEGRVGLYHTRGDDLSSAPKMEVQLDAGHLIDVPDDNNKPGLVRAVKSDDTARLNAWLDGEIVGTRLRDFLAEFPRYYNVEFWPADPRILDIAFYGSVSLKKLDGFLTMLEQGQCVHAESRLNESGKRIITLTQIRSGAAGCRR